jgi:hypothetical protein
MRVPSLLCFVFAIAAICAAQDSNFPAGPQYLMNFGSPLFLRPIATPTLSLSQAPPASAVAEAGKGVELSLTQATPPNPIDLFPIFYGNAAVQESRAPSEPVTPSEPAAATQSPAISGTSGLIEISGAALPSNLPPSIVNVGVQEVVDAPILRERGYGVTLAEASAYWKTHKPHAARVFTNRDVERFHGG